MSDRNIDSVAVDRYRSLFDHSADAILIIENNAFVDCNQAAVDMLEYSDKEALLECHPWDLSPEFQPDGQRSNEKASEILSNIVERGSQIFEWDHRKADGSILPVEVSMTAIPSQSGHTLHIVWRDLSERRRLEKELRHSQKMDAIGSLAGGIAHDFNNTLVPIVSYSELLAHELKDQPTLREWAQEINRAGSLAASTVKKLLAISRREDRRPVKLDLQETTKNCIGMLRKLIGEDIAFQLHQSGGPLWVETDPGDVEHILLNLASNSRDALPSGGAIRLDVSPLRKGKRDFAQLIFRDNGIGMDAATLEQVFTPFFTTKQLGSGTGLGMSSVNELVRKAGGVVNAESSPGKGTTVELSIPMVNPIDEVSRMSGIPITPSSRDTHRRNARILIVEDDFPIMQLLCSMLKQEGYHICTADDGETALEVLETETPDLILTDVVMPKMSGPSMIRELNQRGIHIPVLFLSGYTDDWLTAHGFDASSISFIQKPFTSELVLHRVREALRRQAES